MAETKSLQQTNMKYQHTWIKDEYRIRCSIAEEGKHLTFYIRSNNDCKNYEIVFILGGLQRNLPDEHVYTVIRRRKGDSITHRGEVEFNDENAKKLFSTGNQGDVKSGFLNMADKLICELSRYILRERNFVDGIANVILVPELVLLKEIVKQAEPKPEQALRTF